jgi:predicted outer membrane repeat protein
MFSGNTTTNASGGAIFAGGDVSIGNSNSTVMLVGNAATFGGGAIDSNAAVTLNGSAVTVTGNSTMTNGGAIFASNFTLNATGPAQFSGNAANMSGPVAGQGGAIWVRGNVTLNAIGGGIVFSGNTENFTGTPQANAIYMGDTIRPAAATFNAAAGSTITFFDPIQSNASSAGPGADGTGRCQGVTSRRQHARPAATGRTSRDRSGSRQQSLC